MLGFYIIYMRRVHYYSKVHLYTYVYDYKWIWMFQVYILPLLILSLILYMYCLISTKQNKTKLLYRGFFRICCERMWFLIFDQRCNLLDVASPIFHVCFSLKSFNKLLTNSECWSFQVCLIFFVKIVMLPPTCTIIPLHAKAVAKVVDPTSHHHSVVGSLHLVWIFHSYYFKNIIIYVGITHYQFYKKKLWEEMEKSWNKMSKFQDTMF